MPYFPQPTPWLRDSLSALKRWNDVRSVVLLAALQWLVALLVQPHGNFPINDDWAYAHSVEWLLSEHRVRLSDWIAPNLLPQTLLGGATASLFGFSFETLRHLTQFIAWLAACAALLFFRCGGLTSVQALVATGVLLSMPSWPVLSHSFMSDLYGLVFALSGAAALLRALEEGRWRWILAGAALLSVGLLQRQVILVIPSAFLLAWWWRHRSFRPGALWPGAVPLLACLASGYLYWLYLSAGPGVPAAQASTYGKLLPLIVRVVEGEPVMVDYFTRNLTSMIGYVSWLMAAWFAWWGMRFRRRWTPVAGLAFFALLAGASLATGWLPPYLENLTIDRAGIGPFTVYDGLPREWADIDRSPGLIWPLAGVAAAGGAVALSALLLRTPAALAAAWRRRDGAFVFLPAVSALYVFPFLFNGYFDRYMIFLLPFLMLWWSRLWPERPRSGAAPWFRRAGLAWASLTLILSALATHDYFEWNRARWDAIRHAQALGATPGTLDGGFEYNGYYRFEEKPRQRLPGKSFWWVRDDQWVVAFSAVDGYEVVRRFPIDTYSDRLPDEILLLKRFTPDRAATR